MLHLYPKFQIFGHIRDFEKRRQVAIGGKKFKQSFAKTKIFRFLGKQNCKKNYRGTDLNSISRTVYKIIWAESYNHNFHSILNENPCT